MTRIKPPSVWLSQGKEWKGGKEVENDYLLLPLWMERLTEVTPSVRLSLAFRCDQDERSNHRVLSQNKQQKKNQRGSHQRRHAKWENREENTLASYQMQCKSPIHRVTRPLLLLVQAHTLRHPLEESRLQLAVRIQQHLHSMPRLVTSNLGAALD
jgi:hypothetical protein